MITSRFILHQFERWLVPALFAMYAVWFWLDNDAYYYSLLEDESAEWVTALFLVAAGLVAATAGVRRRRDGDRRAWFLLLFALASIVGGLEEISWGQRVVGVESPEFFLEHSDQQEINVHNVLQSASGVKTKHATAIALFMYGVGLPLLCRRPAVAGLCRRWGIVVPPATLVPSWILATVLMIDWPTGEEEELGEMLYSICLFLLAVGQWLDARRAAVSS